MNTDRLEDGFDRHTAWLAFAWGLAEALIFFVVPDVIVGAAALGRLRRGLLAVVAATVGALLGGTLLFLAVPKIGPAIFDVYDHLPGISPGMIESVRSQVEARGASALAGGTLEGAPYKLYVSALALEGASLPSLLLWTLPNRLVRILPAALLAALFGAALRRFWRLSSKAILGLYLLGWVAIYVAYFAAVGF